MQKAQYETKEYKFGGETMDDEDYKARVKELYNKSQSLKKQMLEKKAEYKSNQTLIKALKDINEVFKND